MWNAHADRKDQGAYLLDILGRRGGSHADRKIKHASPTMTLSLNRRKARTRNDLYVNHFISAFLNTILLIGHFSKRSCANDMVSKIIQVKAAHTMSSLSYLSLFKTKLCARYGLCNYSGKSCAHDVVSVKSVIMQDEAMHTIWSLFNLCWVPRHLWDSLMCGTH